MTLKVMADNNIQISAKQDGALYNVALNNQNFIIKGIGNELKMTRTGLNVTVQSGEAIVHGRHITVTSNDVITLPSNSNGYLVLRIDLTRIVGEEATLYATPTLSSEEINWNGNVYDMPLATFRTNSIDITEFVDVRKITNKSIELKSEIVDIVYPVGSIYTSVNNVSPQVFLGGTWESINGRFLFATDSTHAVNSIGGSLTHAHGTNGHTLSADEIPTHTHGSVNLKGEMDVRRFNGGTGDLIGAWATTETGIVTKNTKLWAGSHGVLDCSYVNKTNNDVDTLTIDASHEHESVGGGKPHSHGDTNSASTMPPYLAVYMWKRVA